MAVLVYGLANCDTTREALRWLKARGIPHAFHDFHVRGLPPETLARWVGELGWEALLNKRGTTFRALPDADKRALNEAKAVALMLARHSLIKRPVLEIDHKVSVGFATEPLGKAIG